MKTVKVRIAVAVDPSGKWNACGWSDPANAYVSIMNAAIDGLGEGKGEACYWIEAELDIPETQVVAGKVVC